MTVTDERENNQIKGIDLDEILLAIQRDDRKAAVKDIIIIRRLRSGDLLFTTATTSARIALEKDIDWIRVVAPSAKVRPTLFPVLVHGVRFKGINTTNQE